MTSTDLEPIELDMSIYCENKYIYKWTIHNFKCQCFPCNAVLPKAVFAFYKGGTKYLGELKLEGLFCNGRIITISGVSPLKFAFAAKISLQKMVILDSKMNVKSTHSASLYKDNKCLLPEDNITIVCEVTYPLCKVLNPYQKIIKEKSKLEYCLLDLFENKHNWDVTFVVAGDEIHAHKCILASRSKVFAAMFKHEMEETNLNRVTITDIDPEVFVEMLRFIYTDKLLNLNKMALDLLAASKKYDLENLKWSCENELANSLSVENAAENLIISDLYGSKTLKVYIINFINCHKKSVQDTEAWKQIVNNRTDLLSELYLNN